MNNLILKLLLLLTILGLLSCAKPQQRTLPYIGFHDVVKGDTLYHKVSKFSFLNQDGLEIDNESLSEGIYVADFFYTYCPSICPKVKTQMLRIYDRYEKEDQLKLVSFALDPKRDNRERLYNYSKNLGVNGEKWFFLTGNKEEIWDLAKQYLISVQEDKENPGEISHSGKIILLDGKGHIRGFAEGTDPDEVSAFMNEIDVLLAEIKSNQN